MATFDAEATLRLVADSIGRMQKQNRDHTYRADDSELEQFAEHVAMVCGWAPSGTGAALLASLGEFPLVGVQREVMPSAVEQAERLLGAVRTLESADAGHDQRVAAATTATGFLHAGVVGSAYHPADDLWWEATEGMVERAREVLSGQPVEVRQTLFDTWTVIEGSACPGREPFGRLTSSLLTAGGVDGRGWLDRFGAFFMMYPGDWTEPIIRAEHEAGRPHPWALATWRRTRIGRHEPVDSPSLWPVPDPGEPWTDRAIAEIEAMPAPDRAAWHALLAHCVNEKDQAKPTATWRRKAGPLLAAVGADVFATHLDGWLALVGAPRSVPGRVVTDYFPVTVGEGSPHTPDRYNIGLLSGLLWARVLCPPAEGAIRSLGRIAERATRKLPGHGPVSPKLANAAVTAMTAMDHPAAVAQLARLASRLTYKSTLTLVGKGLDVRATALGIAREDVEEMALPGFGLPLAGKFGDCAYEVEIRGVDAVVRWTGAAGKPVQAAPAEVRADHREDLHELTTTIKDISGTLLALRDRLDGLLRRDRQWTVDQWRERFHDHPLARTIARRLIWTVGDVAVCWAGDALRAVDDTVVEPADDAVVRLWHPAVSPSAGWREFLIRHGITQPFQQAHRERYVLTDAERATGTYSNRFAAHVVHQHRLTALLARRGWSYAQYRNDPYWREPPRLALPDWNLRAELSITGIDDRDDDMTVFDTMATDGLRFLGPDDQPVPLETVPPVVLSEVMRDIDLFVAAAGVGSDPKIEDPVIPHRR
ncbi:DUF4132 domain-containing protein [Actinoplanes couchii]|uniref:DUF4132 domain-containing protein n=1 Tax=Actinoplanes couchii TaxID=403638 RepID=A0ABQ3XEP7_9ACTN|nr:DUF4132 domain-containing protein [Actinoplanes couchii]MDR6319812.1 hypothetical protein [Actinoplanes couchii]GID56947.1 hypothetical protein Aco03nite_053510 [Actinoplanes couchii]